MELTETQNECKNSLLAEESTYTIENLFAEGISQIFAKYEGMQETLAFLQKPQNTVNWLNIHYKLSLFYFTQHNQHFELC